MKVITDSKTGIRYYLVEEVEKEREMLLKRIAKLEKIKRGNVANLKPRQPKHDEKVQKIIAEKVRNGESKNKLSKMYGVSRGTILNYCKKFDEQEQAKPIQQMDIFENNSSLLEDLEKLQPLEMDQTPSPKKNKVAPTKKPNLEPEQEKIKPSISGNVQKVD